ncbi:MAG: hypothetical protein GY829_14540 [Gammaproteobacteria bacterium]|nr:hypothetical protein [Gammaproteobacteria bacterium]
MTELNLSKRDAEENLEYLENEDDLDTMLDGMASQIGWIIIHYNSLETNIAFCISDMVSGDPFQDERITVFLAEMQYSGICRALINLYGQSISYGDIETNQEELKELEKNLVECGKRRNEYAHADWAGLRENNYVCVKTQAKKSGIMERYRKFDHEKMEHDINFICEAKDLLENFHENIIFQLNQ